MPNLGHFLRVPDTDGVKQKNKHHETIFPLTENKEVQFKESPPCPRNSEKPSVAWYGYFQESPNKKNRSRDNQTTNQETLLRADLKMNLCQWPLPQEEDTFTCFNLSTHQSVTVLGRGGRGRAQGAQGNPTVGRSKYCLEFSTA